MADYDQMVNRADSDSMCGVCVWQVLYKLAYTSSCKRDLAAEDWHMKYDQFTAAVCL